MEAAGHPRLGEEMAPGVRVVADGPPRSPKPTSPSPHVRAQLGRVARADERDRYVGGHRLNADERDELATAARASDSVGAEILGRGLVSPLVARRAVSRRGYDAEIVELQTQRNATPRAEPRSRRQRSHGRAARSSRRRSSRRDTRACARPAASIGTGLRGGQSRRAQRAFLGRGERLGSGIRRDARSLPAARARRAFSRWKAGFTMEQVLGL